MKTTDNLNLMTTLHRIAFERLKNREHALKNSIQVSVLREMYGVGHFDYEDLSAVKDPYRRVQVASDDEMLAKLNTYIEFVENDTETVDNRLKIKYFIEIVKEFDTELAEKLERLKVERLGVL